MPAPPPPDSDPAASITWVLDLTLHGDVTLPDGTLLDREALIEWLWGRWGDAGLAGVAEGTVDVTEAAAHGLVESAVVLDAAAAPADRDWVREVGGATISCWFDDESAARAAAATLADVRGCSVTGVRIEAAAGDAGWRAGFTPIEVPGFGTVRPAWDEGPADAGHAGASIIYIEPGAGFGTGLHETTQLCLAAIAAWADGGGRLDRVLDFGSGSGILGIAAAVRGAGHVDAVEIDPRVHEAIRTNAARNRVGDRVAVADVAPVTAGACDVVVANIVAAVLLHHAETLCRAVRCDSAGRPTGAVILSGLLAADLPAVTAAYEARLGTAPCVTRRGDWHCLQFEPRGMVAGGESCR
jgi:ribosomal protein L11 methyltransferase